MALYAHEVIGATAREVCCACGKERMFHGSAEHIEGHPVCTTLENALYDARLKAVESGWGTFDNHWYCSTCWRDFSRSLERYDKREERRMLI